MVVADNLKTVGRHDNLMGIGNVDVVVATQYAAHMNAKPLAKLKLPERLTYPAGVDGDSDLTDVDVAVEKMTGIERSAFPSTHLRLYVARTKVLNEHSL